MITGRVLLLNFSYEPLGTIGENEILVPQYFYKAVFTIDGDKPDAIGFLFKQDEATYETLDKYVVSIDSIEKITGLDLFANLYGNWDEEIRLEKQVNNESKNQHQK